MLAKKILESLYLKKKYSVAQISKKLNVPQNTINYWLRKHEIEKRKIGDALYQKWNPKGDPFEFNSPCDLEDMFLFGLGVGLYWGEGTKKSLTSVRLGNSDPRLIKKFLQFLFNIYRIKKHRLKFGLQIFGDMDSEKALRYWSEELGFPRSFFQKPIITPYRGVGNYRQKTKFGVLTVYFNNKKLRDRLVSIIDKVDEKGPLM